MSEPFPLKDIFTEIVPIVSVIVLSSTGKFTGTSKLAQKVANVVSTLPLKRELKRQKNLVSEKRKTRIHRGTNTWGPLTDLNYAPNQSI
jgi:hypothetical protein